MSNDNFKIDQFKIEGMDCADCALQIEKEIQRLPGIHSVNVDVLNARAKISYSAGDISSDAIIKAIGAAGHKAKSVLNFHQHHFLATKPLAPDKIRQIMAHFTQLDFVEKIVFHSSRQTFSITHQSTSKIIRENFSTLNVPVKPMAATGEMEKTTARQMLPLIASGFFALGGVFLNLLTPDKFPLLVCAVLSTGAVGWPILKKAWFEIIRRSMGINFLMSVAVIGAFILGEYAEAAMVLFLYALSQVLETKSMMKARNAVNKLFELAPQLANLKTGEGFSTLPVEEINISDIILIKPGEKIPLDCAVLSGESQVNQAPITGESAPVFKKAGDALMAGAVNLDGAMEARVTSLAKDSTFSRILYLVEEAQSQKADSQTFIEKFSLIYTPIMVSLAVMMALAPPLLFAADWREWIYRALVLLVISCPCALVISTPVSIISALTNASKHGVLLKGGRILEKIRDIRAVAFDKTGTITTGELSLLDVVAEAESDANEVLKIAAAIELKSEHHIARPIVQRAGELRLSIPESKNFRQIPGKGASGEVGDKTYFIGGRRLMTDLRLDPPPENAGEAAGKLHIFLASETKVLGRIILADKIKPNAGAVIAELKKLGVRKTIMLTGDGAENAKSISDAAGIDQYAAGLLPADKLNYILENKKIEPLAMVGDGINDAPALAASDLGVVMGVAGTDTALESADVALMTDDLAKIPYLIRLSRLTMGNIKQNIFIALFLKFLFFLLTFPGVTTLWMAVFADTGASLIVIFNGLRLLKIRE